jgi:hypothetical protein
VIHNTAQAHDWVDFIRRSQSKDPMCVTHFDSLASDSESIVKRFMDHHSQKPNTSSGRSDVSELENAKSFGFI